MDKRSPYKITRPVYSDILLRKALFSLLDRARRRKVVWISAPAGSGKTTLVSSYLSASRAQSLWYQLDGGDAEPSTFFYYMGLAARKAAPRKRPLALLTPEYQLGLPTFSRRFFEGLCERLKPGACIVLDNYHELPSDSPIHELLCAGFDAIPDDVSVIVASRGEPPPAFSRLVAGHALETLEPSRLLLTRKEAADIMRMRLKGRAPAPAGRLADEVYSKTNGWAAGVTLFLEQVRTGRAPLLGDATSGAVFDYFDSVIMSALDEKTRRFLLETSVFTDMDAAITEKLTGLSSTEGVLAGLSRSNCFTEKRLNNGTSYQYHALFREFLLARALETFGQDGVRALKARAAKALSEAGRLEESIELLLDAGEWQGVAGLIMAQGQELLSQGRGRVIEGWITRLPSDMVEASPWLLYWLGASLANYTPAQALGHIERAFRLFRDAGDAAGVFLSWAMHVYVRLMLMLRVDEVRTWLDMLDELLQEYGGFPSEEVEAVVATSYVMGVAFTAPASEEMKSWFERGEALAEKLGNIPLLVSLRVHLLLSRSFSGAHVSFRSDPSLSSLRCSEFPVVRLYALWYEIIFHTLHGKKDGCLKTYREARALSDTTGVRVMDYMLTGHCALTFMNAGDMKGADALLAKMEEALGRVRPFDVCFYHYLMAHRACLTKDLAAATRHSMASEALAEEIGFTMSLTVNSTQRAFILCETGKFARMDEYLRKARGHIEANGSRVEEFYCRLLEACAALKKKAPETRRLLEAAFSFGRENAYYNFYAWQPGMMAELCQRALEEGVETEFVRELIRKKGIAPEAPPMHVENWPWQVRIYTLGRFSMATDDGEVEFSRKAPRRPLELIKAVIALGGRDVKDARLMDMLWPDADGDAAYRALVTTLHRARRLPGLDRAIDMQGGMLTLDSSRCWVDAWAFERMLAQYEEAVKEHGHSADAMRLLEKAVGMYKGDFLSEGSDRHWALSYRERLRNRLFRHLDEAADALYARGEYRSALGFYLKGVEVDHLAESFYQGLMSCYQRLGMKAEGLGVYGRLKKVLWGALAIEPSPRTEGIRALLLSD